MRPIVARRPPAGDDGGKRRRYRLVEIDSAFVGVVSAGSTFLPIFVARLGGSGTAVGLLTAIPAVVAFSLAMPMGRWLQTRSDIIWWYSRLRFAGWCSYGAIALAAALVPAPEAVWVILAIWAVASLPSVAGLVAFPIVMDAAAGPHGRFDLLGRRWAISGLVTSVTAVATGRALFELGFPANFEALFALISLAGLASCLVSSRIELPADRGAPRPEGVGVRGLLPPLRELRKAPSFVLFEGRSIVYTATTGLMMPILPLFYVRELHAPNDWIGLIGGAQSAGAVVGYTLGRGLARRHGGLVLLLPALAGVALVPAILSILQPLPAVAAIVFVNGMATAGAQLALFDELMKRVPRGLGVTFSAVDQSAQNLALIAGPMVGGLLVPAIGARIALVVPAVVGAVAFALFAVTARGSVRFRAAAESPTGDATTGSGDGRPEARPEAPGAPSSPPSE